MLDTYRGFNVNISTTMGVPYIDMRTQMQNKVPWIWPIAFYFVTVDGEHLNYRGTHILAKMFGDSLRGWITSRNNQTVNTTNELTVQAAQFFEQRKIQLSNMQQQQKEQEEMNKETLDSTIATIPVSQ